MDLSKTTRFDAAEYLVSDAERMEYLLAALETGDFKFVREAFETVLRSL